MEAKVHCAASDWCTLLCIALYKSACTDRSIAAHSVPLQCGNIIYIVGAVVIVLVILSFVGLV